MEDLEKIVEACRRNDRGAQGELYALLAPRMLGVCYRYLQSRDEAEEAMQDSFVKIFLGIKSYKGTGAFEAWARRIAVNTSLDMLRKKKRIRFENNLTVLENIDLHEEETESVGVEELISCMRQLPEGYRTIVNLFAVEEYSHAEIAALLNIQESTSRSQYARARQSLVKMMKERLSLTNEKKA